MNSNVIYIKCKVDEKLNDALKKILTKLNITQQDFLEKKVKEFVLENIDIVINSDTKVSKNEKL